MPLGSLQIQTVKALIARALSDPTLFAESEAEYCAIITPYLALHANTINEETADSLRQLFSIDISAANQNPTPRAAGKILSRFVSLLSK